MFPINETSDIYLISDGLSITNFFDDKETAEDETEGKTPWSCENEEKKFRQTCQR